MHPVFLGCTAHYRVPLFADFPLASGTKPKYLHIDNLQLALLTSESPEPSSHLYFRKLVRITLLTYMPDNATNLIVTQYRPYIDDMISYHHIAQH